MSELKNVVSAADGGILTAEQLNAVYSKEALIALMGKKVWGVKIEKGEFRLDVTYIATKPIPARTAAQAAALGKKAHDKFDAVNLKITLTSDKDGSKLIELSKNKEEVWGYEGDPVTYDKGAAIYDVGGLWSDQLDRLGRAMANLTTGKLSFKITPEEVTPI